MSIYRNAERQPNPMVVTMSTISEVTGSVISRTTAYQLEKIDPDFPKRRLLLGKRRGGFWFWDEIEGYLERKSAALPRDAKDTQHLKRALRQRVEITSAGRNSKEAGT